MRHCFIHCLYFHIYCTVSQCVDKRLTLYLGQCGEKCLSNEPCLPFSQFVVQRLGLDLWQCVASCLILHNSVSFSPSVLTLITISHLVDLKLSFLFAHCLVECFDLFCYLVFQCVHYRLSLQLSQCLAKWMHLHLC